MLLDWGWPAPALQPLQPAQTAGTMGLAVAHRIDYAFRSRKEGGRSASEEPMVSLGPNGLAKPCGICLTIEH